MYKYTSKTIENFIHGNIYFLRRTKDGIGRYLTSENCELQVGNGKMSLISNYNQAFLKNNFTYEGYELYKNYKDFRIKTERES